MSSDFEVWLIDDGDRSDMAKNLGHPDGIRVSYLPPSEFINENGKRELPSSIPDLVLVDWQLNSGIFNRNLSVFEYLREKSTAVPIYGFSVEDLNEIPNDHIEPFDRFYDRAELDSPDDGRRLLGDIEGYKRIESCGGGGIGALIDLLNPPSSDSDREAVRQAIPQKFYDGITEGERDSGDLIRDFGTWVRDELTEKPGLLWNSSWLSTKLGMEEEVLDEYARHFEEDKYDSVFAHESDELWWKSKVYARVASIAHEKGIDAQGQLWERAPVVLDVPEENWAKCFECEEYHPQSVAINEDRIEVPVHYSCSFVEDTRESPFEDLRRVASEGE